MSEAGGSKGPSATEVLSRVSGVPKPECDAILEQVKANLRTLDACEGPHDFQPIAGDRFRRQRCAKCGGALETVHASWYKKGVEHGRQ